MENSSDWNDWKIEILSAKYGVKVFQKTSQEQVQSFSP